MYIKSLSVEEIPPVGATELLTDAIAAHEYIGMLGFYLPEPTELRIQGITLQHREGAAIGCRIENKSLAVVFRQAVCRNVSIHALDLIPEKMQMSVKQQ
jgi:hypothetical protein